MKHRVDITPDKSLIRKTGLAGYSTAEAIAELVDNSIDARVGRVEVSVHLDFVEGSITVTDDGHGMDVDGLRRAMTVARGSKPDGTLGRFGMGMKSSCSALGGRFRLRTSPPGSGREYGLTYDEEEWLADGSARGDNYPISEDAAGDWHGTSIRIDRLKVPLYPNQSTNLRRGFGRRYASYIRDGEAAIRVNKKICEPPEEDVEEGSRIDVELRMRDGSSVRGHVGLLRSRSVGGDYGMDLYKNGRLIRQHVKFGFVAHPENARITGRLEMDDIPVNFQKNGFITESAQYREALREFAGSGPARRIQEMSRSGVHDAPSMEPVFGSLVSGSDPPKISRTMGADAARAVMEDAAPFTVDAGGRSIRVSMRSGGPGPLYDIRDGEGSREVVINRDSAWFSFVRNPLFLVGMIAAEVSAMPPGPEFAAFLRSRNEAVERIMGGQAAGPGRAGRGRARVPDAPGYGLAAELVGLHDHLVEESAPRFQFTAMSTLVPYLHNAKGTVVYTVHTVPGSGEDVAGMLSDAAGGGITVMDRPDRGALRSLLGGHGARRVIAVREFRSIRGPTVAGPYKAVVDMLAESKRRGVPVGIDEVGGIIRRMIRDGILDGARLAARARSAKRSALLEEALV
ncbi:MAG: ATP-binding protein [Nitrosopumilus sp.]|nr:ATP-binding protein [Nitrosopumilus sp.]